MIRGYKSDIRKSMDNTQNGNATNINQRKRFTSPRNHHNDHDQSQKHEKQNIALFANQLSSLTTSNVDKQTNMASRVKSKGVNKGFNVQGFNSGLNTQGISKEFAALTQSATLSKNQYQIMCQNRHKNTIYETEDNSDDSLTFGPKMLYSPQKNMILSERDHRTKTTILKQISDLRKSQGTLLGQRDGIEDSNFCVNHSDKKAKYRNLLKNQANEEVYYCSKCAIYLLQQGHRIEQLRQASLSRRISKSVNKVTESRIADIRHLQDTVEQVKQQISASAISEYYVSDIDQTILEKSKIYQYLTEIILTIKASEIQQLNKLKQQRYKQHSEQHQKAKQYTQYIMHMKRQLSEQKSQMARAQDAEFNAAMIKYHHKIQQIQDDLSTFRVPHSNNQSYTREHFKTTLADIMQEIWQRIRTEDTGCSTTFEQQIQLPIFLSTEIVNQMPKNPRDSKLRSISKSPCKYSPFKQYFHSGTAK